MLHLYDVYLTCCDHWREVDVDDLPMRCPYCQAKLKWGYDKTDYGPMPHVLRYTPHPSAA